MYAQTREELPQKSAVAIQSVGGKGHTDDTGEHEGNIKEAECGQSAAATTEAAETNVDEIKDLNEEATGGEGGTKGGAQGGDREGKGGQAGRAMNGEADIVVTSPAVAPIMAVAAEVEADRAPKLISTRWVERDVGQLRLLVPKAEGSTMAHSRRPRLVMRVEHVGRLILNEFLLPSMAMPVRASDTSLRLVLISAELQPVSYLLRVKMTAEANALCEIICSHISRGSEIESKRG